MLAGGLAHEAEGRGARREGGARKGGLAHEALSDLRLTSKAHNANICQHMQAQEALGPAFLPAERT